MSFDADAQGMAARALGQNVSLFPNGRGALQFGRQALRYAPTWGAVYANAPTTALAGPGGASPINTGSPQQIAYTGQQYAKKASAAAASGAVLTFASTTNILPGVAVAHAVAAPNIPAGTTVVSVTNTTVTLSNSVTSTGVANGDLIAFGQQTISFLGMVPAFKTQNSSPYYYNACNAAWTAPAFAIEFDYYGADLAVRFRAAGTTATFWLFVDGQPTTATPYQRAALSSGSLYYERITFNNASDSTARWRRVRLVMDLADFGGIDYSPTESVAPVPALYPKVAFYGDSWVEGALTPLQGQQTLAAAFGAFFGSGMPVVPFKCGQGGTGFISTGGGGSKAAYTDSARLTALYGTAADLVIVEGSINDNGQTQAAVQAAATTVLSGIKTNMPTAKLLVLGCQPTPTAISARTTYGLVNSGVQAACAALNVPFIDWYNLGVITGSGNTGTLHADGNADIFIGTDGAHLVPGVGTEAVGRWLASQVNSLY